jgi:hypothetical protein
MRQSGYARQETPEVAARIDALATHYRGVVRATLEPLVAAYYPDLLSSSLGEYRKMLELSTKMTLVGHACTEISGYEFDEARQRTAALFGGCCFLADSFLDDFGMEATQAYMERFATLLSTGWFEIRSDRERLFYVIISRLFLKRDVLDPIVRQAILQLHMAQVTDVRLRLDPAGMKSLSKRGRWTVLRDCARNRSGHAIIVLSTFLVPRISLDFLALIFSAGALVMYIDDHGDCYTDLKDGRITYMNQVRDPERALRRIFTSHMKKLEEGFPCGNGRDLLLGFLVRYYRTRLAKHRHQKLMGGRAWDVYE